MTDVLLAQQLWLRLGGGLFLLYLGIQTFRARPGPLEQSAAASGLLAAYASTFLLTLANPTTILSFVAIFAGLGPTGTGGDYALAGLFVLGVFLGSGAVVAAAERRRRPAARAPRPGRPALGQPDLRCGHRGVRLVCPVRAFVAVSAP